MSHAGGLHSIAVRCYLEMSRFFSALALLGLKLSTIMRGQNVQRLSKLLNGTASLALCRWPSCCAGLTAAFVASAPGLSQTEAHCVSVQGGKVQQARMDAHELLWPLFRKADAGMLQSSATIHSKVQQ